jgi:hypothetical protein
MATRNPVRPLNQTAASHRANAKAEADRKKASKAAARAAREAAKAPTPEQQAVLDAAAAEVVRTQAALADAARVQRAKQDAANAVSTHFVDFVALGMLESPPEHADLLTGEGLEAFNSYLLEQGVNPDGTPNTAKAGTDKPVYTGPMLALRARAKAGAYVKMANGNPSCADALATALGGLTREQVVTVLIAAMGLGHNPYSHLNPGQQSMNLRNKARGQFKAGTLTLAQVEAAIERAARHPE